MPLIVWMPAILAKDNIHKKHNYTYSNAHAYMNLFVWVLAYVIISYIINVFWNVFMEFFTSCLIDFIYVKYVNFQNSLKLIDRSNPKR